MKQKIGENEFNAIKLTIGKGMKQKDISELVEISIAAIGRINSVDTWKEYQNLMAEEARKAKERYHKNKVKSKKVIITEVKGPERKEPVAMMTSFSDVKSGSTQIALTNYQMNRLLEKLEQQNEYLKLISAKLAFVVEQLA